MSQTKNGSDIDKGPLKGKITLKITLPEQLIVQKYSVRIRWLLERFWGKKVIVLLTGHNRERGHFSSSSECCNVWRWCLLLINLKMKPRLKMVREEMEDPDILKPPGS